jgi:site-specific DNA recombinase
VTPQALSRIEALLLPEIDAAERRALPRFTSPLVAEVAGADARDWWAHSSIVQKREVISTPTETRPMQSKPGRWKLDPYSVEIIWRR